MATKEYRRSAALFDPSNGLTIATPPGSSAGYWAGACSVFYDNENSEWFLYYRTREPRPVRGGKIHIASSQDGKAFSTIWTSSKADFGTESIEKSCLVKLDKNTWVLYVSYVDPVDNRWRIDYIEASHPSKFNPKERKPILTAATTNTEGVKDPVIVKLDGVYHMYYSYAHVSTEKAKAVSASALHSTADAYNTGLILSSTGLATSSDGRAWTNCGAVLAARGEGTQHWDSYCARVTAVWPVAGLGAATPTSGSLLLATYDGARDVSGNYEERTGLAISADGGRKFLRLSEKDAVLVSPHASGSLRYVEVLIVGKAMYWFYEYARQDGSHELRHTVTLL